MLLFSIRVRELFEPFVLHGKGDGQNWEGKSTFNEKTKTKTKKKKKTKFVVWKIVTVICAKKFSDLNF